MDTIGAGKYNCQDRDGIPDIGGLGEPSWVMLSSIPIVQNFELSLGRSLVFLLTVSREDQIQFFSVYQILLIMPYAIYATYACHLRPHHCNCFLSPECSSEFDKKYANICIWVNLCNSLNNVFRDKDFFIACLLLTTCIL